VSHRRGDASGARAVVPIGLAAIPDIDGTGRAAASFLLVLGVAAAVRYRRPDALDRAVDATLEQPLRAPLYGVAASVLGWLVVAYAFGQALRLGGIVGRGAVALGVGGALLVGGFGFVVVGAGVTTVLGDGRPWTGPLVGASGSALVLVALPARPGLVVWVLVAATGLGGVARRWLHASQSVERRATE
jgi:hypothetical protein